jgi:hypothetical protein
MDERLHVSTSLNSFMMGLISCCLDVERNYLRQVSHRRSIKECVWKERVQRKGENKQLVIAQLSPTSFIDLVANEDDGNLYNPRINV